MSQDDYFEHDSYDRNDSVLVEACPWYERLRSYYPNGSRIGENIAWNYRSPEAAVEAWMNSEGHRANILGDYREIGVGFFDWYWDENFGSRNGVYPVVINGEASTTDSAQVKLYIYGSWTDIRLRNDGGDWSDWQTFSNEIDWQIPAVAGVHTVEVEIRSGSSTYLNSDSIEYTGRDSETSTPTPVPTATPTLTPVTTSVPADTPVPTPTMTETSKPGTIPPVTTPDEPATPTENLETGAATYLGGNGTDNANAIDIGPDNSIYVGGAFSGYDNVVDAAGQHQTNRVAISQGANADEKRGVILRLVENGDTLHSATIIGNSVADLEVRANGDLAACGDFGVATLGDGAATLKWFDKPSAVDRCAIGADGIVAVISAGSVMLYDAEGTAIQTWPAEMTLVSDVAVFGPEQLIVATGYRQASKTLQVAAIKAWNYNGELQWTAYDHDDTVGLNVSTRGKRVVVGRDGLLYFVATVDGSTDTSIFARDPFDVNLDAEDRIAKFDEFNNPDDVGSAKITWYGRYDPATGELLRGQSLLARQSNGSGNSVEPYAIAADRDGRTYIAGSKWADLESRDAQSINDDPVGPYEDGEPFLLVVTPKFDRRIIWTTFARTERTAGESPATGVAVRNGTAAITVTASAENDRRLYTDPNGLQPDPQGASDGYAAVWQQIKVAEKDPHVPIDDNLVYLPLVVK